jgi:hypothetical protein
MQARRRTHSEPSRPGSPHPVWTASPSVEHFGRSAVKRSAKEHGVEDEGDLSRRARGDRWFMRRLVPRDCRLESSAGGVHRRRVGVCAAAPEPVEALFRQADGGAGVGGPQSLGGFRRSQTDVETKRIAAAESNQRRQHPLFRMGWKHDTHDSAQLRRGSGAFPNCRPVRPMKWIGL